MKPGDIVLVRFPQADLHTGKLWPALVIALARLATVDTDIISARLGEISSQRMNAIKRRLAAWLHT